MQAIKLRTIIFKLLKIIFAFCILIICISPFIPNGKINDLINQDLFKFNEIPTHLLPILILVSILNFLLEIIKWRTVGKLAEDFTFKIALKSVFSGIAVSSIFPWKTGEFIGKIAWLKENNRVKGALYSVYSSMTQLFNTILFGLLGLFLFSFNEINKNTKKEVILISIILLIVLMFFLIVYRNRLIRLISKLSKRKLSKYLNEIKEIPFSITAQLFFFSFLRYLTFVIPYLILIQPFATEVSPYNIMGGIAFVFLLQSIIPSFILSDLPIRGFIHISVFSSLIVDSWIIGNAVVVIFVLNQIIPALIGTIFLLIQGGRRKSKSDN